MISKPESRAIVVGGSIAGLLAARTLSDHLDEVIVLEKDKLVEQPALRQGTPQSEQLHSVHQKGAEIIQKLFPDLAWDFESCGVLPCDLGGDMRWLFFGKWMPRVHASVSVHWCERPILEWQIRKRVQAIPNVRILSECKVTSLVADESTGRATGVTIRSKNIPRTDQSLSANLVIDASGRGSRINQWLKELGYPKAPQSEVKIDLGYGSRYYQLPEGAEPDWKAMLISAKPGLSHKLGLIYQMPGNQFKVSLLGWFGDHPTTDGDEFLEFARSLPVSDLYEQVQKSTPLTPVRVFKIPSNQRQHFEQMARWPDGLFVVGDALCSFNPSFGQGMTVAALQAVELGEQVAKLKSRGRSVTQPGFAKRFQKSAARIVDNPWMITTGEDLRFPQTQGPRPLSLSIMHRYLALVFDVAHRNPAVAKRFFEVMTFMKEPPSLFGPKILFSLGQDMLSRLTQRQPLSTEQRGSIVPSQS